MERDRQMEELQDQVHSLLNRNALLVDQNQFFEQDFKYERQDKQRAEALIQSLRDEVRDLKQQLREARAGNEGAGVVNGGGAAGGRDDNQDARIRTLTRHMVEAEQEVKIFQQINEHIQANLDAEMKKSEALKNLLERERQDENQHQQQYTDGLLRQLGDARQECTALKRDLQHATLEQDQLRATMRDDNQRLQDTIEFLRTEKDQAEKQAQEYRNKVFALNTGTEVPHGATEQIADLRRTLSQTMATKDRLDKQNFDLLQTNKAAKAREAEYRRLQDDNAQFVRDLKKLRHLNQDLEKQNIDIDRDNTYLKRLNEKLNQNYSELTRQNAELKVSCDKLSDQVSILESHLHEREKDIQFNELDLITAKEQVSRLENELKIKEEQLQDYTKYCEETTSENEKLTQKLKGNAQDLKLKEKMESMRHEFAEERKVSYKEREKLLKELNESKMENTRLRKALEQFKTSEATVSPPIAKPRRNSKVKFYPKTEEREATQSPDVSRPSRTTPMNVSDIEQIHTQLEDKMSGVVKSLMKKELEAMQKQFDAKNEEMKKELDTKNKVIEACNKKISDLEQERQQKQQQQLLEQLQAQQQQIQQLQQLLQSNVSPPLNPMAFNYGAQPRFPYLNYVHQPGFGPAGGLEAPQLHSLTSRHGQPHPPINNHFQLPLGQQHGDFPNLQQPHPPPAADDSVASSTANNGSIHPDAGFDRSLQCPTCKRMFRVGENARFTNHTAKCRKDEEERKKRVEALQK